MAKIITVTSGKGGVGKTNISVNLAIYLAGAGYRTCLFDADMGLANVNILLGIYPEDNLADVIAGKKQLKDIVLKNVNGIDIIPGSSGVAKMAELPAETLHDLAQSFTEIDDYDYVIFDTSAGISKNVLSFCLSASEVVLVITPEPTSLTDAYALMKVLSLNGFTKTARVVVNQSKSPKIAQAAYTKLKDTVRKFLGVQLSPLGTVVADARVLEAVAAQQPLMVLYPNSQAARCIRSVGKNLLEKAGNADAFPMETFWHRCMEVFTAPLKMPTRKKEESAVEPPVADRAVPPQPSPPPQPSTPPPMPTVTTAAPAVEDRQLLERLVDTVASMAASLGDIRTVLEKGAFHGSKKHNGDTTAGAIALDFEAFLEAQDANHQQGKG